MAVIKAQQVPKRHKSPGDLLAEFCFYFPQYKYHEARKLPAKRVLKMLDIAYRENAKKYFELTQISSAPHTKKGAGVKKLLDRYKRQLD